jgi:hypothetical protein
MQLDYMVLADYVRQEPTGVVHIMSAGIDTIVTPVIPNVQQLGIALRFSFDSFDEVGSAHRIRIVFQTADGRQILNGNATINVPQQPPGVPEHWRTRAGVAVQLPVPLPQYGDYSLELDIDDGAITSSTDFRVIPPAPQA